MNVRIKVPGKLIVIGEYAVLEGANALVAAVDRYVIVTVSTSSEENLCQITSNLDSTAFVFTLNESGKLTPKTVSDQNRANALKFAITAIEHTCNQISNLDINLNAFQLHIDTTQFYAMGNKSKYGLGSSAALTVGVICALLKFYATDDHLFKNKLDLFRFAINTHLHAQGNRGSGIDISASIFGGVSVYNIGLIAKIDTDPPREKGERLADLYMMPVWTGVPVSTRQMLSATDNFKKEDYSGYRETMLALKDLSDLGCIAYMNNDKRNFLEIIENYYTVLKNFSDKSKITIISDVHQKISGLIHNAGGIYKPSGAGGGDFGLAFFEDSDAKKRAQHLLRQNDFILMPLKVESNSVAEINNLRL